MRKYDIIGREGWRDIGDPGSSGYRPIVWKPIVGDGGSAV